MLETPVVLTIFNRPDKTELVFNAISKARPRQLFVIADGPRPDAPGENERCLDARAIIERVDWDCCLRKNYSDVNMGCKRRVSSGLDWVFSSVEEAILLEDDTLPSHSFLFFCQELLEKYRYDNRINYISGTNYQLGKSRTDYSYFFSRYASFWGWATWRRAWRHYDVDMKSWPQVKKDHLLSS
ncbi:MAG: glycosyltransferase family 2 protein, partial [Candidatus Omnitrophica bacterium]|nr:glycosyltransferase family 2 protein [Candidatus Omnitrophota bacterium]